MSTAKESSLEAQGVEMKDQVIQSVGALEYEVTWNGSDDPESPYNWPMARKYALAFNCSCGGLVTLMSGAMLAPALDEIARDLNISATASQLTLSIYVLSFGFGPMVLAPLTEIYGRKPVWLTAGSVYVIFNTVCGFAHSNSLMLVSRLLAGLGASAEFAVTRPVLSDCWLPSQRGKSFTFAAFIPLLGPAVGPLLGGFIAEKIGWRWIFWVLSIFQASLLSVTLVFFPETHAGILLMRRAKALRAETGQPYYAQHERKQSDWKQIRHAMSRPVRMFTTEPIIVLISIYLAYIFGIIYFVLSTYANLWINVYHESTGRSGLHYLALAIGYIFGAQTGALTTDIVYRRMNARTTSEGHKPEYRVPLMIPGMFLIPVGLCWYGWSAQTKQHWIMVDVGAAIYGMGVVSSGQAMQIYVMDSFPDYVASAAAASELLRNIAGFVLPIAAPKLYEELGYGWTNTLLAAIFIVIVSPAPYIIWRYGPRLRAMGKSGKAVS